MKARISYRVTGVDHPILTEPFEVGEGLDYHLEDIGSYACVSEVRVVPIDTNERSEKL